MTIAADLLVELRAAGVTVAAAIDLDGPVAALTDARIAEVRRLKPELLRLLVGVDVAPTPHDRSISGGTVSVGAVGAPETTGLPGDSPAALEDDARTAADPAIGDDTAVDDGLFTAEEQDLLAGSPPATWAAALAVKAAFRGVDELTVFEIVPSRSKARDAAARIIREARRRDGLRARDLLDAWEERVAICTVDGDLSICDAEAVALNGLGSSLAERQG